MNTKKSLITCCALLSLICSPLFAGEVSVSESQPACSVCQPGGCACVDGCGCADGHNYFVHAPIGVMGDHVHHQDGWMFSYRYMMMGMQRNYDGDSQISDAAARSGYMMTATDMDMQMHMMGVMYAPTQNLTLSLMANYLENDMSMVNAMGMRNRMHSSGWGDVTLSGFYRLYQHTGSSAHLGVGLSIPTGSIDETLPSGANQPYMMQLGSGTWDLKPSITWLGHDGDWSYGSQAAAIIRLGRNDNGYSLGDSATLTGWVSRRLAAWSSISLRLTASTWGNVDGHDDAMPRIPMGPLAGSPMAATADPDARGGSRIDAALGFNFWSSENGVRFGIEAGVPVYQHLDGPQLGVEWFCTLGLQVAW